MAGKSMLLQQHNDDLNKLLEDNKSLFLRGTSTGIIYKQNLLSREFEAHHIVYIKSKYKELHPSVELSEKWAKDIMISYCYRFVVPFFEHCCACVGRSCPVRLKKYEFRYERHDMEHQPDFHMHVFDGLPPRYHTKQIDFKDFFEIIKRDFIKNNLIDFDY